MELMPSCPHCGCTLTFFEHYDCYDTEDKVLCFANGYCPKCRREYRWTDVYKLSYFEDLEEVNKNENC